jgi:hypothetical protein
MPNHCMSELTITGKPKKLHKLLKQVEITNSEATTEHEAKPFSCQKIIPRPSQLDYDWYNWNTENWGSKWDLCEFEWITNDWEGEYLHAEFWTAWSPIPLVLQKLSEQHKTLEMTYRFVDEGGGFYGTYSFKGGLLTVDEQGDDFTCDVKTRYGQGEEHHCCQVCDNWFECLDPTYEGHIEEVCTDCKTSIEEQEQQLWEEKELVSNTNNR